ncbi:2-hydroxyacid dehydrogenase [Saliterribacillus persicus]|uniref:Gluconate 2-dehydrogenase n=1 Tax=Saliterribacillus persicus TaxID=930114 RepID=A0A368XV93_9BACI|nr:D-glycerate dehydrogenase [Saliterribacillus persicus]RCW71891.1 gluconate 2-dehydrogenase [Saliterribacillus persicus]
MSRKKILITEPVPEEVYTYLNKNAEVEKWQHTQAMPKEELKKAIRDVHALVTAKDTIDEELLSAAKELEVVSNISVGYDNFNIEAIKKHNIAATHTPYVLDETVADLVFGLILSSARRIPELDQYVKNGNWTHPVNQPLFGFDVHHQKLGIIGMGRIGEKIVRRATKGFEMDVFYHNRTRNVELEEKLNINYLQLDQLLSTCDFILLMTPLTDQTYHMINAESFKMMKKSAFFINAARGAVVNEKDLIEALQNQEINGAGLDVFEQEPINKDNPLLKMNQVVTVPHIGSATTKTRTEMALYAAKNAVQVLEGNQPDALIKELRKDE